jgi:hypothetical protein
VAQLPGVLPGCCVPVAGGGVVKGVELVCPPNAMPQLTHERAASSFWCPQFVQKIIEFSFN